MFLPRELPSLVTATYHRILRVSVDYALQGANSGVDGPLVSLEIGEYLSAEARHAGALPIRTEVRTFVTSDDAKAFLGLLYAALSRPVDEPPEPVETPAVPASTLPGEPVPAEPAETPPTSAFIPPAEPEPAKPSPRVLLGYEGATLI